MFDLYRINNVRALAPSIKQIPANSALTYNVGEALVITGGKAAKATGTTAPTYICAETGTGLSEVSAYAVDGNTEYKTTVTTGTPTIGAKYTIHTDSAQITDVTTSGVAEVVAVLSDGVVVKF